MQKIRISVGNLVPFLNVKGTGEEYIVGILNQKAFHKDGKKIISPIGGGAKLRGSGVKYLSKNFNIELLEGLDARFLVDDTHLDNIISFFRKRDLNMYHPDPLEELFEELSEIEIPELQDSAILNKKDVQSMRISFLETLLQPFQDIGKDTSARKMEIPTRRIFNIFKMTVSKEILEKMKSSTIIYFLTKEEVRKNVSKDGIKIANNMIF